MPTLTQLEAVPCGRGAVSYEPVAELVDGEQLRLLCPLCQGHNVFLGLAKFQIERKITGTTIDDITIDADITLTCQDGSTWRGRIVDGEAVSAG